MKKEELIAFGVIGAIGGAITALSLSFTTWPTLVIGGIIGAGAFAVFLAVVLCLKKKSCNKDDIPLLFSVCATSTVIGAGLAAAADAIFSGIFAKWSAIAAGAVIGAIGLVGGALATKLVIMPMIEKIGESFSSERPDSSVEGTGVTGRSAEPHRT